MYLHSMRTFEGSERKQSLSSSYPKYLYKFVSILAECITFLIKWTKEAEIIEICTQLALESNLHRNNTDSMRCH